jgi:hypothetical protein
MPQSFGLFASNFTLRNMVCDDCNKYFGDNLEIVMARDTLEGASRFKFALKSPNEFRSLGKRSRVTIKVAEGDFKGAYAYREYSQKQDKIMIRPAPQIGFLKRESSEYEYYLMDQIPQKDHLENDEFDLKNPRGIRIIGTDIDNAREVLCKTGIKFQFQGEADPSKDHPREDILCEINVLIDTTVYRAFAKIAFNYLAYWEGMDFVLHQSFDPMRNFIRYGKRVDYALVTVDDNPILGDEQIEGMRRLGHMITVNWAADKISLVSQVSIFNDATYTASLARNFAGERRNISRGHFFDVHNHKILNLRYRRRDCPTSKGV